MGGIHFTVIGAVTTIALTFWLIKYASGAYTIGYGGTKALGNIPRTFTANPGKAG